MAQYISIRNTLSHEPDNKSGLKLARNKDRYRIWLEGGILSQAGFKADDRIDIVYDENSKKITIAISESGERKICGKGKNLVPVIDINNKKLESFFNLAVERIMATVDDENNVIITVHPTDAAAFERLERIKDKLDNGTALNIGSVSHGGGILDHAIHSGLSDLGIKTKLAFAIEINQKYLQASMEGNPIWDKDSLAINADMRDVPLGLLPKTDINIAGLPCVGASSANVDCKIPEAHPSAGTLFVNWLSFNEQTQPVIAVLENVPEYSHSISMTVIRSVLKHQGYELYERVFDANEYGALEKRKRMCLVAVTRGLPFSFDHVLPTHKKQASVREIMEPVPLDSPMWKTNQHLIEKEKRDKAAGKGHGRRLMDGSESYITTLRCGYNKAGSDDTMFTHPEKPGLTRLLTKMEHAMAKRLPKHFAQNLIGRLSATTAHEILGNSVAWSLFHAIGKHLGQSLLEFVGQQPALQRCFDPVSSAQENYKSSRPLATAKEGHPMQLQFTL
jgi:DNA (cytosine-5)-methyltransferase 1